MQGFFVFPAASPCLALLLLVGMALQLSRHPSQGDWLYRYGARAVRRPG